MDGHLSATTTRVHILKTSSGRDFKAAAWSRARKMFMGTAAAGFGGSLLVALAAPLLVNGGAISWWYSLSFPFGLNGNRAAEYIGMALLSGAWLVLGYVTRTGDVGTRGEMWAIAIAWMVPLVIAPAVFSRDMYSYLAQGAILHAGLDPYHHGPIVLRHLGYGSFLAGVSPFWWRTPAPYGPLFLGIVSLIVSVTGSHLVEGVIVVRMLAVIGTALVATFGPRLARLLGADPVRAIWLGVMSPLAMFELVLAGHNDALMAGLMVAGVTLALEGRYRTGIVLCALASVVKLPALAAVVFLVVVWLRSDVTTAKRVRRFAESASLVALVVGGVSAATGVGLGWFSSAVLTVPGKVHLAITPVTQLGWTIGPVLRALGAHVSNRSVASGFGVAADIGLVIFAALLLWRTTKIDVVFNLGAFFLFAAFFGPAAWPWYFIWGLALLASVTRTQRSVALPGLIVISVFLVKPDGILALPVGASPILLAVYLVVAAFAIARLRRSRRDSIRRPPEGETRAVVVESRS